MIAVAKTSGNQLSLRSTAVCASSFGMPGQRPLEVRSLYGAYTKRDCNSR